MAITSKSQTVQVDGVEDIPVTEAVQDPETGDWVREIRILVEDDQMVYVLRVASDMRSKINIVAPVKEF